MKQSINLYRIETITKPQLSIARMAMLWLGFLLLAISFVLWQAHQFKALQTQLNTALEMKNSAEYKLNATHLTTQNTIANHPAKDEALKIKEKIHSIEAKINWLQQQSAQPSVPLTAYLEAMAWQHVNGTMVSYLVLHQNQQQMTISGVALAPELVPQMIDSWQKKPAFSRVAFQTLAIKPIEAKAPWVRFYVQAKP